MAIHFLLRRAGDDYYATPDAEPEFLVGQRTTYSDHGTVLEGLFTPRGVPNIAYKSSDFADEFGFWAAFIQPTTLCESNARF